MKIQKKFVLTAMVLLAAFSGVFGQLPDKLDVFQGVAGTPTLANYANPVLCRNLLNHAIYGEEGIALAGAHFRFPRVGNTGTLGTINVGATNTFESSCGPSIHAWDIGGWGGNINLSNNAPVVVDGDTVNRLHFFRSTGTNVLAGRGTRVQTVSASNPSSLASRAEALYPNGRQPRLPDLSRVDWSSPPTGVTRHTSRGAGTLSAGVHVIDGNIRLDHGAILTVERGTIVYVRGTVVLSGANSRIVLAGGAPTETSGCEEGDEIGVIFLVYGSGNDVVSIDIGAQALGTFIAPRGQIKTLGSNMKYHGQILAREVSFGNLYDAGINMFFVPFRITEVATIQITPDNLRFELQQCGSDLDTAIVVRFPDAAKLTNGAELRITYEIRNGTAQLGRDFFCGNTPPATTAPLTGTLTFNATTDVRRIPLRIPLNATAPTVEGWNANLPRNFEVRLTGYSVWRGSTNVTAEFSDPRPAGAATGLTATIRMAGTQQTRPTATWTVNSALNTFSGNRGIIEYVENVSTATGSVALANRGVGQIAGIVNAPFSTTPPLVITPISYTIVPNSFNPTAASTWFTVNPTTGVITTADAYRADYENTAHRLITFSVAAISEGNLSCVNSDTVSVSINVLPWNDRIMALRGSGAVTLVNSTVTANTIGSVSGTGASQVGTVNITINEGQSFSFNGASIVLSDADAPTDNNRRFVRGLSATNATNVGTTSINTNNGAAGTSTNRIGTVVFTDSTITYQYTRANNNFAARDEFYYTIRDTAQYGYNTAHFDLRVRVIVTINPVMNNRPEPQPLTIFVCDGTSTTIGITNNNPASTQGAHNITVNDADRDKGMPIAHRFVPTPTIRRGGQGATISIDGSGRILYSVVGLNPTMSPRHFEDTISYRVTKGNRTGFATDTSTIQTIIVRIRPVNRPLPTPALHTVTFAQSVTNKTGTIPAAPTTNLGGTNSAVLAATGSIPIFRVVGETRTQVTGLTLGTPAGNSGRNFTFSGENSNIPGIYEFDYTYNNTFTANVNHTGAGATLNCTNPVLPNTGRVRIIIEAAISSLRANNRTITIPENRDTTFDIHDLIDALDMQGNVLPNTSMSVSIVSGPNSAIANHVLSNTPGQTHKTNTRIRYRHGTAAGLGTGVEAPFNDVITYSVTSGSFTRNGTITITITPRNDNNPVAVNQTIPRLPMGVDSVIRVPAGCSDLDQLANGTLVSVGTPLTFSRIDSVSHPDIQINGQAVPAGGLAIATGQTITVSVVANSNIPLTGAWIDYRITDNDPNPIALTSNTARITFTNVIRHTGTPEARDSTITPNEGQTVTFNLSTVSRSHPATGWTADSARILLGGNPQTHSAIVNTQHGTIRYNAANRTFTYAHDHSENFTDSFEFEVWSSSNPNAPVRERGTVTINVRPRNDNAPVIHDFHRIQFPKNTGTSTIHPTPHILQVIAPDDGRVPTHTPRPRITDVDVNTHNTLVIGRLEANGDVVLTGNNGIMGEVIYSNPNFGTVTPTVMPDRKSISITHSGEVPYGSVLEAKIVVSILDTLLNGQAAGVLAADGDRNVRHIARPHNDANGFDTIIVTVTPSMDNTPRLIRPVARTILENATASGNLNDYVENIDGDGLRFTVREPAATSRGRAVINLDGSFTYEHAVIPPNDVYDVTEEAPFADVIYFRASAVINPEERFYDGTINITITPTNDNRPVAVNDFVPEVFKNIAQEIYPLVNDYDIDELVDERRVTSVIPLKITKIVRTSHPDELRTEFITIVGGDYITVNIPASVRNFDASDNAWIEYEISDNNGLEGAANNNPPVNGHYGKDTAKIYIIAIRPYPDMPRARPDSISVNEGGTVDTLITGARSVFDNDDVHVDATTLISYPPNKARITTPPTLALEFDFNEDNGTFRYVHDGSENFRDEFWYQVRNDEINGEDEWSLPARVFITISPRNNNEPVRNERIPLVEFRRGEGRDVPVIADNDGANAGARITDIDWNTRGTLILEDTIVDIIYLDSAFAGTITAEVLECGKAVSIRHDNTLILFGDSIVAKIVVEIKDTILYGQEVDLDSANGHINRTWTIRDTIFVRVNPSNDNPPTGDVPTQPLIENGTLSINLREHVVSLDGFPLTFTLLAPIPANLSIDEDSVLNYAHGLNSDGERDYTIESPFRIPVYYSVTDGNPSHNIQKEFVIDITPINDNDPVAVNDTIAVLQKGRDNPVFVPMGCFDLDEEISNTETGAGRLVTVNNPLKFHDIVAVSDPAIEVTISSDSLSIIVLVAANATITNGWVDYEITDNDLTPTAKTSNTARIYFSDFDEYVEFPTPGNGEFELNEGQTLTSKYSLFDISTHSARENWEADDAEIVVEPVHGTVTINADGTFTYSHDRSENFTDSFRYIVRSAANNPTQWSPEAEAGVITITIKERNDNVPVIHHRLDTVSIFKNTFVPITVIASNDGAHTGARITDVDVDTEGTLILGTVVEVIRSDDDLPEDEQLGIIGVSEYEKSIRVAHTGIAPLLGDTLHVTIVVEIKDILLYGEPECDDPLMGDINVIHTIRDTIFVRVLPSNDNPPDTLSTPIYYLHENETIYRDLKDFIFSPDGFSLEFAPFAPAKHGDVEVNEDGSFTYTHRGLDIEIFTDTFTVLVASGPHTVDFDVILRIYPRNDEKPVVTDGEYIRVYAIDTDGVLAVDSANGIIPWIDDADRYPVFDGNWNYNNEAGNTLRDVFVIDVIDEDVVSLSENRYGTNSGVFVIRPDGSFGYTPGNGFTGRDSIELVVKDFAPANLPHGGSSEEGEGTDPIWIKVAVHELPFAVKDSIEVREGGSNSVNLITNESGRDYNPSIPSGRWTLTATEIIGTPKYGTFTLLNGNEFTYTSHRDSLTGTAPFYLDTLQYEMTAVCRDGRIVKDTAYIIIRITANAPIVDGIKSFYEDTLAKGIVNKVTIPFDREIDVTRTKFTVEFGGREVHPLRSGGYLLSEDERTVYLMLDTAGRNIATDGLMKVTIEFDERFENVQPAEIFPLDSAAPVVTSARYIRAPGGKDTLILAMSEQSDIAIGGGNAPFKFVRGAVRDSLYEIRFDDRSLLGVNADGYFMYRMVIASPDSAAIFAGDSVFVNWEATTVVGDNMGNLQENRENRRVPIDREISASILSATYFSRINPADGYIDLIKVELGTPITLEIAKEVAEVLVLSPSRNFTKDIANVTLTEAREGFYLPVRETRREATITSAGTEYRYSNPNTGLFADDSVRILTPVKFDLLTVGGGTRAIDNVAPVVLYAEYILGEGARNNHLNVVFSEPVTATNANPYKFLQQSTNDQYDMVFRGIGAHTTPSPNILQYQVDSTGVPFPLSGDSIWIVLGGVVREGDNIQNYSTVRAPLILSGEYPADFDIFIIPQPLRLMQVGNRQEPVKFCEDFRAFYNIPSHLDKGVAVVLDARGPINPDKQRVVVKILDQTGNAVTDDIEMTFRFTDRGTVSGVAVWNGKNRSGRTVGASSYLALISGEVIFDDGQTKPVGPFKRVIVVSSGH